ncbi:MAG: MarR family transcriptional regulator [Chloroflexota bacterium]|nr:MarR family transcriptional regulator [Dehalococcoidia bacterium]MDW8252463.1 MarR family transcriptional regulator [Chloroflexota bacterium]
MTPAGAPAVLKLLADDLRWRIAGELRWTDRTVRELVEQLGVPQNLVSYHLGLLRAGGLVRAHRSDADGRATYYALDAAALDAALAGLTRQLSAPPPLSNVAFVCTHNQARSQMAEGWFRHLVGAAARVRSAGVDPRPLHPLAIRVMAEAGIDISGQRSNGLDALLDDPPELVITVCDRAREACPPALGVRQLHWSIPSPVDAPAEERLAAFRRAREEIRERVARLVALVS